MSDEDTKPEAPVTNLILDPSDFPNESQKPFAKLLDDPQSAQQVFQAFYTAILRSFVEDAKANPLRDLHPSREELKHRWSICEAWFRRARGDLGYSQERALDNMYRALRAGIDGQVFDPGKADGRIWTPT